MHGLLRRPFCLTRPSLDHGAFERSPQDTDGGTATRPSPGGGDRSRKLGWTRSRAHATMNTAPTIGVLTHQTLIYMRNLLVLPVIMSHIYLKLLIQPIH